MTVNFAHCLFEQSGTFKREFQDLGIDAKDYDFCNDFGQTDVLVDIFGEIERAYWDEESIFDEIKPEDLIFAFFPCTYFNENNTMFFSGTNINYKGMSQIDIIDQVISRAYRRHENYMFLLKLCHVVERRQLKMIVENPYNAHHYLRFNFPYKPAVIDMNRRRMGDFFRKPTQYIFVNCSPAGKRSLQMDKSEKFIREERGVDRSLISPDYAHNFICDHILGIDSGHTQPTLFNF